MRSDARPPSPVFYLAPRETSQPFVSFLLSSGKNGNITNPLALMRFWARVAGKNARGRLGGRSG